MNPRRTVARHAATLVLAALTMCVGITAPSRARAETVAPDSTLDQFLGGLSDSTDTFFGQTAAPTDSAGLDSALGYGLANPKAVARSGRWHSDIGPDLAFNRVDGPVWGARTAFGRSRMLGLLTARLQYAAGPNDWLGGGAYSKVFATRRGSYRFEVAGGRETATMDRTGYEHHEHDNALASSRALLAGSDTQRYLRHDGWETRLTRRAETWSLGVGWRDALESPLAVTTGWNLTHANLVVPDNLAAAFGRTHEATFDGALRVPHSPWLVEATYTTSRRALGSDFEYRRTRAAIGGNFGLGRFAALVPQFAYGRLSGDPVPQAAFYLGGASTLGRLEGGEAGGTGLAVARLDLIGSRDILALAHIPHPAMLPLQLGAFAATGAVWGPDPYGGPARPGVDWPDQSLWQSETGVSVIYQPGLPDPTSMVRFNVIWPVGPGDRSTHLRLAYTRAIGLLRTFGD